IGGLKTRTTGVSLRDYDFKKPRLTLESVASGGQRPALEEQVYPGHFTDRVHGKYLAQRMLERHRSDFRQASGHSDQPALLSGRFLKMAGHPRQAWNDLWLVTQVTHVGRQPQVLEESAPGVMGDEYSQGYSNDFVVTPWDVPFRTPLLAPRPPMSGYQNAVVPGPAGSEIHCEGTGRAQG
ncbi:contractile injection system protein, VgrG/Pvc8 family, partial [Pseudomonas gingeri]|uniref:contractile injection system protein, VgrG/Pvc8 family n=1 Tax=Pseudomonas gingeri TaxID=117681 RepID=UPI0017BA0195